MCVKNPHLSPILSLSLRQKRRVRILPEESVSENGVHQKSSLDNRAEITSEVSGGDHLVIFDFFPNLNFTKKKTIGMQIREMSVPLCTDRLKINPAKNQKKNVDKRVGDYIERYETIGLRMSGHRVAGIFIDSTEEPKSLGTNSTTAILKSNTTSRKHSRQQRSIAWSDSNQKSSSAQSVRSKI